MGTYETVMLVGDSMIEYCDWQQEFTDRKMINLGRSGETVAELLHRLPYIVRRSPAPDLILVMIGTNNVAMEDFSFGPTYQEILQLFGKAYPAAVLVVNSLLPMALPYLAPDTVPRINVSLREIAQGHNARYLDVWREMTTPAGHPLPNVLADEVHLTGNGYRIWAAALKGLLGS